MKTLKKLIWVPAFLLFAHVATASTYIGSWKNKTFDTTGALTIDLTIKNSSVSGSINLDGPVFGGVDPPAIPFNVPRKANGSGSFKITGTAIGDLKGSFKTDGTLTITITNIPGGFLTEARINGKLNAAIEKFTASYEVDASGGLYASGVVEAHVPKAPVLKVANKVTVSGSTGTVQATVVTNTKIKSFKATAPGSVTITITGKNPYQIKVKGLTAATTNVKITVTNADGFHTSKTVKFVKSTASLISFDGLPDTR